MRVTEKMMFETGRVNTGLARTKLEQAVAEVSSGKRIRHPSDDPAGSALLTRARLTHDRFEAIKDTVGRASDELNIAEGVMGELSNVVQRGREMAMQLSSSQFGPDDRAASAQEVDGLLQTLVGLMNTEVAGRYIFGGFQDGVPPFDATGGYLGDAGVRQVEIAPGVFEPVSLRVDVAVKGAGGGVDIPRVLSDFAAALRNNDIAGIQGALEGFDSSLTQVSAARMDAGASLNILQTAEQVSMFGRDHMKIQLVEISETNLAESATRLALANTALEAAISATAQSFRFTLLDKL